MLIPYVLYEILLRQIIYVTFREYFEIMVQQQLRDLCKLNIEQSYLIARLEPIKIISATMFKQRK